VPATDDETFADVVDLLGMAAKKTVFVEDDDGRIVEKEKVDRKTIYYGTRIINTSHLGEAVVMFERLEQKAYEAKNYMSPKRAKITEALLLAMCDQYRYGLDSKSSESQRDGKNNQATMMHLLRKQTIEREFTTHDEKTKKLLSGFLGTRDPEDV
jgi:hypothetical protein